MSLSSSGIPTLRTLPITRGASVAVAVALAAVGLPDLAHAQPRTHSASFRLAEQPLAHERALAHSPASTSWTYTIQPGDTLGGIAAKTGSTVDALRAANGISGSRIIAGKSLVIPGNDGAQPASAGTSSADTSSGTTSKSTQPAHRSQTSTGNKTSQPAKSADHGSGQASSGGSYTVKAGDTLSGIAGAKKTTVTAIRALNSSLANSTRIYAGQTITVPAPPASQAPTVGKTFAGRTYSDDVVKAAQANKDELHRRDVPSRRAMKRMVAATAQKYGVDPKLAMAIAYQESGFNMRAVSPANAVGVMQVIPSSVAWASQMAGRQLDALNPQDNVTAGILLLKALQTATGGDEAQMIAAYYQGLRSIRNNGLYADTKIYVANVQQLKSQF